MEHPVWEKLRKYSDHVGYLRDRWQDEKEYEDWSEYEQSAKSNLPEECGFLRIKKRPFVVEFLLPEGETFANNREMGIRATTRHIHYLSAYQLTALVKV